MINNRKEEIGLNNKKQFILDSKSLKIKEILNKDFLEIEILDVLQKYAILPIHFHFQDL